MACGTLRFLPFGPLRGPRNCRVRLSRCESRPGMPARAFLIRKRFGRAPVMYRCPAEAVEACNVLRGRLGSLAACRRFPRGAGLARRLAACAAGTLGGGLFRGPLGSLLLRDLSHVSSLSLSSWFFCPIRIDNYLREKRYGPVVNCALTTSTCSTLLGVIADLASAYQVLLQPTGSIPKIVRIYAGMPVTAWAAPWAVPPRVAEGPRQPAPDRQAAAAQQQAARAAWAAAPARPASWPSARRPCPEP